METVPMTYREALDLLKGEPRHWLVTGAAGFIGSHLVEALLQAGQYVRGLDNFFAGFKQNLDDVHTSVGDTAWARFEFLEGDMRNPITCRQACEGMDHVLHHAAASSVPMSVADPVLVHEMNVTGFVHMLVASRDAGVQTFVYASSCAVYGDDTLLPKRENVLGRPLSPYAVTKRANELYAAAFFENFGLKSMGLRYFNVFGRRQTPDGAYAAVIPLWFRALMQDQPVLIHGDGDTTRDFCFIDNCVQANILASLAQEEAAWGEEYNIAVGERISLNELFEDIRREATIFNPKAAEAVVQYGPFRAGDIRHTVADITKAQSMLGYSPTDTVRDGLKKTAAWYAKYL